MNPPLPGARGSLREFRAQWPAPAGVHQIIGMVPNIRRHCPRIAAALRAGAQA